MSRRPKGFLAAVAFGLAAVVVAIGLTRDWWTAAAVGYVFLFLLAEVAGVLGLADDDPHAGCEPSCTTDHCC